MSIDGELLHELPWRLYGNPTFLDRQVPTVALSVLISANPWLRDLDADDGWRLPGGREIIVPAIDVQGERQSVNVGWT